MKHKVSELTGGLLDAAVALALGYEFHALPGDWPGVLWLLRSPDDPVQRFVGDETASQGMIWLNEHSQAWRFAPSIAWEHGGPIIDRENIAIQHDPTEALGRNLPEAFRPLEGRPWHAWVTTGTGQRFAAFADAPLVAAMRAFVCAELGKEVDLP